MASMRASQPELVWGPWRRVIPPKKRVIDAAERIPVEKMAIPVRRSFRVSGCILGWRVFLAEDRKHGVDHDARDRDVEPYRIGVPGDSAMKRKAAAEGEIERDEDHRKSDDR